MISEKSGARDNGDSGGPGSLEYKRDIKKLAIMSAGLMVFFLIFIGLFPPHEGDSSEYAGIARNILTSGEIREDILKDYGRTSFEISRPATSRGAFFPFFVIPFYLLFKKSILTLALPGAVAYFFLPLAVYVSGRERFGREVSFWAAVLTLFNTHIAHMYFINEPLEPEMYQALFHILAVHLFLKGGYVAGGVVCGVSCMTKQTSLILPVCVALHAFLFDRRSETMKGAGKFIAVTFIVMSPVLVRNQMVFNAPFYSEQTDIAPRLLNELYDRLLAGEFMQAAYDYEFMTSEPAESPPPSVFAKRLLRLVAMNAWTSLTGRMTEIGHNQGLIEGLYVFLFFFMLAGFYFCFRDGKWTLFGIVAICYWAFLLLAPVLFIRYMLPVFPIANLMALYGFSRLARRAVEYIAPLSRFILAAEFAPFLVIAAIISITGGELNNYKQTSVMCDWVLKNDRGEYGVIVGFPYTSLNFLCEKPIVAFPVRGVETIEKLDKRYNPTHIFYTSEWKGDRLPMLSGMLPELSNGKHTLFRLEPGGISAEDSAYLGDLDFVNYYFASRFRVELFKPMIRSLRQGVENGITARGYPDREKSSAGAVVAGWILGPALYVLLFALFLRTRRSGRFLRKSATILIFLLSFFLSAAHIHTLTDHFPLKQPDASVVQLFSFIESKVESQPAREEPMKILINRKRSFIDELIKNHPDRKRYAAVADSVEWTENARFDMSMDASGQDMIVYFEKIPERSFNSQAAVAANRREINGYLERLDSLKDIPSLTDRESVLMNGMMLFH